MSFLTGVGVGLSVDSCLLGHFSSALCWEAQPEPGAATSRIGMWPGLGAVLREVLYPSWQSVLTGNTVGSFVGERFPSASAMIAESASVQMS